MPPFDDIKTISKKKLINQKFIRPIIFYTAIRSDVRLIYSRKTINPSKIVFLEDSSKPAANAISSPARRTRQVRAGEFWEVVSMPFGVPPT